MSQDAESLVRQIMDFRMRSEACRQLVMIGEPAVEALCKALAHRLPAVRWAAANCLLQIGSQKAVPSLIEALDDMEVASVAADALSSITGQKIGADEAKWREWYESETGKSPEQETGAGTTEKKPRTATQEFGSPEALLEESIKGLGASMEQHRENEFNVYLTFEGGRQQRVRIIFGRKDRDGAELVIVFSDCGPAEKLPAEKALKMNLYIPYGALALREKRGQPWMTLVNTLLLEGTNPYVLGRTIQEIARRADKVERVVTGSDKH